MNNPGEKGADFFAALLKKELVTAMGCTEPAAAALAAAAARKALGVAPERILIRASRDIIKNAMYAGIPNTTLKGILSAAALGIASGDPSRGLNILSGIDAETDAEARRLAASGTIALELAEGAPALYVEARLWAGGRQVTARILREHTNLEVFEGLPPEGGPLSEGASPEAAETGRELFSFQAVWDYAGKAPLPEIAFLLEGARTNMELARYSLTGDYGIRVGKTMLETGEGEGEPVERLFRLGASLAAAASDARMAGCSMPVVINSGSGNQGITVSVPVLTLAEGLGRSGEETVRALCLAHLTALMLTARKDRLSALCGAFTAASGAAAGFVRLLGGGYAEAECCVGNMVGNLMGLLCDGAKGSCALKIFSCVEAAALGARLALAGRSIPPAEGILGDSLDGTLRAVERISHDGMIPLDKTVLALMMERSRR